MPLVVVRPSADLPLRWARPGPVLALGAMAPRIATPAAGPRPSRPVPSPRWRVRVLVVDNYDSFVYNLVQELGELGADPVVYRNDAIDVARHPAPAPRRRPRLPGPGPARGRRRQPGAWSRELAGEIPILGVCLGHQCIGQAFGGRGGPGPQLMHGKTSEIHHAGDGGLRRPPEPVRGHPLPLLVVTPATVPAELEVTATTADGVVMGLRHRTLGVEGVQFHPESIFTPSGPEPARQLPRPGRRG